MNTVYSIAIDGPAGAGKSTVAKMAAKELGFVYIDTGAMYRAIALNVLRHGIDPENRELVVQSLESADIILRAGKEGKSQQIFLNGEDVTAAIRKEEVGNTASSCSVIPEVRSKLVAMQRRIAENTDVVMDGRDIGTVVLPNADLKIYLTASVDVRAGRRILELRSKGQDPDPEEVRRDIRERDERDMTRKESPLRQAEDAVFLDSSDMTAEEAAEKICSYFRERRH